MDTNYKDDEEKTKLIEDKRSKDSLLNILQNLERDLIIKNNCQKEFDLKDNNDEIFEKIEIIGNPDCYFCLKSKKMIIQSNYFIVVIAKNYIVENALICIIIQILTI